MMSPAARWKGGRRAFLFMNTENDLIELYRQMAALTNPLCGDCGDDPCSKAEYRCCSREACENARVDARDRGVELKDTGHPDLPFMAPGSLNCTVAPHLRPRCTKHICPTNPMYADESYRALKTRIEELER